MQPQAPVKNYIFFFASVIALMFGWNTFKAWKWPPPPPVEIVWPLEKLPKDQQATMLARLGMAATGRGLADVVDVATQFRIGPFAAKAAAAPVAKEIAKPAEPAEPPIEFTLGGPGYAITATVTNQGAGVRELILNHVPTVDKYGKHDEAKKPLALIPRVRLTAC